MSALTHPIRTLGWRAFGVLALGFVLLQPNDMVADATSTAPQHCLWKVTRGDATLYLGGSMHLMSTNQYPLAAVFDEAYAASSKLVLEMDLAEGQTKAGLAKLAQAGLLPAGRQLADVLTPDTQQRLIDYCQSIAVSPILFNQMKPWMALLMLTQLQLSREGFQPQLGLDAHFHGLALNDRKSIVGLETLDQQLTMLESISKEDPNTMILHGIEELRTLKQEIDALVSTWENGNTKELEALLMENLRAFPSIYRTLIVDRNHRWMKPLLRLLRTDQTTMVIVGAGHVVGKEGLIALLASRGCKIEQL